MSSRLDTNRVPVGVGAVAGALAWLIGYVCTYIVAGTRIRESNLGQILEFLGEGSAIYKLVGWVFYNSHLVNTVVEGAPFAVSGNAIGGNSGFTVLLYLIPPAVLLGAGLAVGRYSGVETPGEGALAGLSVVPLYLLLSVVGIFLFSITAGPATGRPDPLLAVALAGVFYPAVFGAAGAALAGMTSTETTAGR